MPDLPAIKETFDRDGFVIVRDLLSPDRLVEVRGMIDGVLDGTIKPDRPVLVTQQPGEFHIHMEPGVADDPNIARRDKIRTVFHMCHTHSFFWDLATSPEVLNVVEALIGPDIKFYTDQMFVKPAHHGTEVPWHQDSAYWPNAEPGLLSVWLAIDDVNVENGCVRFLPGSHRSEIPHETVEAATANNIRARESAVDPSREVPVEMTAGSASFHHSLAAHRSLPNTSDKGRRGLIMIYLPADLKFKGEWPFAYGFKTIRGREPQTANA